MICFYTRKDYARIRAFQRYDIELKGILKDPTVFKNYRSYP